MPTTDPTGFLPLKPHWLHVLLSLKGQDQHGTLKRLMDEDLIEESTARPESAEDDARRRYYRLTRLGRRVLAAESERLEDLVRVIHAKRGARTRRAES